MHKKHWLVSFIFLLSLYACSKSKDSIDPIFSFQSPPNFPPPIYHFGTNEVTKNAFELGRKLFYEPRLSRNNTISCGSCHIQSSAFTQHGHDVSHGIDDRLGSRNSPPIMNLAWSTSFMWDGGVFDLDLQPIVPITAHEEMDETMPNVFDKLRNHPDYPRLFKNAFGTDEITTARFTKALSQFMLMCISSNAKYDKVMRKEGETFTANEQAGYQLVKQKCGACHTEPLFTDNSFRNNGIGAGFNNDEGRMKITLNQNDRYKFKVPSLRNLSYTAPYMHDGRFYTLDAVLQQYALHVQLMPNLDPILISGGVNGIKMSAQEQSDIKAFLLTLDDKAFIDNKLLSEQ